MSMFQLQEVMSQILFFILAPCIIAVMTHDFIKKLDRKKDR